MFLRCFPFGNLSQRSDPKKLVVTQWNTGAELERRRKKKEESESWERTHSKKPLKIAAGKGAKQHKIAEEKTKKRKDSNLEGRSTKKFRTNDPPYVKPGSGKLLLYVSQHEPTALSSFYHSQPSSKKARILRKRCKTSCSKIGHIDQACCHHRLIQ